MMGHGAKVLSAHIPLHLECQSDHLVPHRTLIYRKERLQKLRPTSSIRDPSTVDREISTTPLIFPIFQRPSGQT